jgi:predicted nuclease of predicted toxin-antitoxin system
VKLLIDMNLAPRWVSWLRAAGIDAVHWSEVGAADATDSAIFAYARERGLVVFTHDLDFSVLLAHTRASGPSVVQVRARDTSPEAIGALIVTALEEHGDRIETGALVTLDQIKARVRILPVS